MRPTLLVACVLTAFSAAAVPDRTARGDGPGTPSFEVHEIGYLDLNRKQTVHGWLREIPATTSMQAQQVMALWARDTEWRDTPVVPTPRDPALLFYSNEAFTAQVTVGFRQGAPVAWWPAGSANQRSLTFAGVRVNPKWRAPDPEQLDTVKYPGLAPLKHIREIGATPVRMGARTEGGLVYEGILPFNPQIVVRHLRREGYEIHNASTLTLHDVILIPDGERERGFLVGDMAPDATFWIRLADVEAHPLAPMVDLHLQRTGLFPKEVVALRKTLLSADFVLDPGVRLLARLPRQTWDHHFPINIFPRPRQLVRVGVVRLFDAVGYRPFKAAPVDPDAVERRGDTQERRPLDTPPGTAGAR